jgi:dephospho-CoA kinase
MLHVGLTGGLASGKSYVGSLLAEFGCHLIRMDDLARQAMEPDGAVYPQVVARFTPELGAGLLHPDGTIDRRALAAHVFADPARLERLNALVHPHVRAQAREMAADWARLHPHGIVVTEAAILIETGSYQDYDRLILAVCRPEQQIQRALARAGSGLTREEVLDRMRRQIPLEEKRKYAHYVIDTSGSKEETRIQTRAVYQALRSLNR